MKIVCDNCKTQLQLNNPIYKGYDLSFCSIKCRQRKIIIIEQDLPLQNKKIYRQQSITNIQKIENKKEDISDLYNNYTIRDYCHRVYIPTNEDNVNIPEKNCILGSMRNIIRSFVYLGCSLIIIYCINIYDIKSLNTMIYYKNNNM